MVRAVVVVLLKGAAVVDVVTKENNDDEVDVREKCCCVERGDVVRAVVVVVFLKGAAVVVTKESERVVAGDFVDVVGDKDFFVQGERRRAENEVGAEVVEDVGRWRGVVVERAGNVGLYSGTVVEERIIFFVVDVVGRDKTGIGVEMTEGMIDDCEIAFFDKRIGRCVVETGEKDVVDVVEIKNLNVEDGGTVDVVGVGVEVERIVFFGKDWCIVEAKTEEGLTDVVETKNFDVEDGGTVDVVADRVEDRRGVDVRTEVNGDGVGGVVEVNGRKLNRWWMLVNRGVGGDEEVETQFLNKNDYIHYQQDLNIFLFFAKQFLMGIEPGTLLLGNERLYQLSYPTRLRNKNCKFVVDVLILCTVHKYMMGS